MYNSSWYNNLTKPVFAPPDWLFTPVWGMLYTAILGSFIFYMIKSAPNKKAGYIYFAAQLVLNFIWSPIFFIMKNMALALLVIIFMIIFTFLSVKSFFKVSKISGILLFPYFLWICFAAYLNLGYFILN